MIDDETRPPGGPDGDSRSGEDPPDEGEVSLFHASWPEPRQGLDFESIVDQYGQRLFVLAYRLTGDREEAEELSQEALASSREALAGAGWTAFDLCRALVHDWRASLPGRWGVPSLKAPWRRSERAAGIAPGDWLQAALMRLGPRDREVLVLRVGEGLDYEEIAAALGEPAGVVQRRLFRARRHLHEAVGGRPAGEPGGPVRRGARRRPAPAALRAMSLYLDDRVSRSARAEFERRLEEDPALRAEVEFHRGLTLEFQEEAPFPPRDYLRRTLARLERPAAAARIGGMGAVFGRAHGASRRHPIGRRLALAGVAAVLLAAGLAGGVRWIAARRAAPGVTSTPAAGGGAATPPQEAATDEETLQALRSLGYLGSGAVRKGADAGRAQKGSAPRRKPPAKQPPGSAARPRTAPGAAPGPRATPGATPAPAPRAKPAAVPQASPSPSQAATPRPDEAPVPEQPAPAVEPEPDGTTDPAPGPPPAGGEAPEGESIGHRFLPAPRRPGEGRDHEAIGSSEDWAALHGGAGAPPVDFEKEWVVLLRDAMGTDPPTRLRVAAVRRAGGTVEIVCHAEPIDPAGGAVPAPGQALVLPLPVSPVRIVIARP